MLVVYIIIYSITKYVHVFFRLFSWRKKPCYVKKPTELLHPPPPCLGRIPFVPEAESFQCKCCDWSLGEKTTMASSPKGTWGLEDLEDNKNLLGRRIDHPVKKAQTPLKALKMKNYLYLDFFLGGCWMDDVWGAKKHHQLRVQTAPELEDAGIMMGLAKGDSFQIWPFVVSMFDFWGKLHPWSWV